MAFNAGTAVGYLMLDTSGFTSGFQTAKKDLNVFKDQTASTADKFAAVGSAMTSAGKTLTKGVTLPLVGIGAASVKVAADFESSMSTVQATLGVTDDAMSMLNGESVNTMDALEALARQMGAETAFSAQQAADSITNLAMAGYSVQEIYDSLPSMLNLAAAGELDLADAARYTTNGLNVMGMAADQAGYFADVLATTATNADGSVQEFAEGILVAGGQAQVAGQSFETVSVALGLLGNAGIHGSEGGTMLRNTMKNLYTPTDKAAKALEELGIQTYDASGNARDMQLVLQDLKEALSGMTQEEAAQYMATIFDTRTIAGARALLEASGVAWDELAGAIEGADGAAEKMAKERLNNLTGALTILKSALSEAAISIGEVLIPVIQKLAEFINKLITWFNNLSPATKQVIVVMGAIAAAIGPVLLIVGKLVSSFGMIKTAITALGPVFTFLTSPIGLVVAGIAALVAGFLYLWNTSEGFRNFWINLWENVKSTFQAVVDFIQEKIEQIKEFFANLPENIRAAIDAVVNWFQTLPERIAYWLGFAVQKVIEWVTNTYNTVKEKVPEIIEAVVTFFSELPGKIWNWLLETIAKVTAWASDMLARAKQAGKDFVDGVINFIKDLPKKVESWFQQVIDYLNGINLLDIGKKIMQSLYDGLKKIWDDLWAWLSGLGDKIASAFSAGKAAASSGAASVRAAGSLGVSGGPGGRASGSYASGLDYVPRDMLVKVHEGETIRTRNQTKKDLSTGGGDTFIFNSPTALTPIKAAQEMKKTKQQLALGFR